MKYLLCFYTGLLFIISQMEIEILVKNVLCERKKEMHLLIMLLLQYINLSCAACLDQVYFKM
jgi:hypothetical protein